MRIAPRETVVLAEDFAALVAWYRDVLGLRETLRVEDDYHYCNLENDLGLKVGIADAAEMGVTPQDRGANTVLLQVQVPDVRELFAHLERQGGTPTFGPSYDEKGAFWYGGFKDLEGNPIWVVDESCP